MVRVFGQTGPQLGVEPMGWELSDGIQTISPDVIRAELPQLFLHPQYAAGVPRPDHNEGDFPISHNIKVVLPNNGLLLPYDLNQPFTLEAIVSSANGEIVFDRLGDQTTSAGTKFVLQEPVFPHCFPQDDPVAPGDSVAVQIEDLDPNGAIHVLLGPTLAANGMTDANGDALVSVPIPLGTRPGLHLITAGTDGTALTADCHVLVVPEPTSLVLIALGAALLCGRRRLRTLPRGRPTAGLLLLRVR